MATVTSKGVVTAVGLGTAVITARTSYGATGNEKAEFFLTVTRAVASIALSADRTKIKVGDALNVTAKVLPADALNALTWSSSKAKIATVTSAGRGHRGGPGYG